MRNRIEKTGFKLAASIIIGLILCGNVLGQAEDPVPVLREGVDISSIIKSTSVIVDKSTQQFTTATQTITFENGVDGHVIQSGIPGVTFSTTNRQDWLYGDKRTGNYNVDPYGTRYYRCHGNFFAWLGPNQGRGRIDFTEGTATAVSVKYSSYSTVYLEAYAADGIMIDQDVGSGNLNQPMGTLSVSGGSIAYVIFHDSGNYWLIDDVEITLDDVELLRVDVLESSKSKHHTSGYSNDFVLRRGETIDVDVRVTEGYDESYHTVSFVVKAPDASEIVWSSTMTGIVDWGDGEKLLTFDVDVPGDAQIGEYELTARLNYANGGTILDTEVCPDTFYIIFNPWSSEDTDVYKASEVAQLDHYVLGNRDWNYYGKTDCSKGADTGYGYCVGAPVKWVMGVTNSSVFAKAIEDVAGEDSAREVCTLLRKKVQYYPGHPETDIIIGSWNGEKKRWDDVPAIVNWSGHPYGQCMDFSATLTALARSLGVPSRMTACAPSGGWNFHCWAEMVLGEVTASNWSAIDGTPISADCGSFEHGFGPTTRNGCLFQYEVNHPGANAVYTYGASSGGRIDIKSLYGVSATTTTATSSTSASASDVDVAINLDGEPYLIGDEVRISVAVTNSGSDVLNTNIGLSIRQEFYNATIRELPSIPARAISVPAGDTMVETYTISRDVYEYQGRYLIVASAGEASVEERFEIDDGLEVSANMVLVTGETDIYDVTANVRNILTRDIDDLHVEVCFPGSAEVPSNPLTFDPPIVTAGDAVAETWRVRFNERGVAGVVCFAESEDAGYDKANADADVRGDSKILCVFESIDPVAVGATLTITAKIENLGGVATDVDVELLVPSALSSTVPTSQTVVGVAPGEVRQIIFDARALEAGNCAIIMTAEDYRGDSGLAIGVVQVFDTPRDISVTVQPGQVPHDQISHVNLLVTNNASIPDDVVVTSYASAAAIQFSIFDGNTRILGRPVIVLGNSTKTLEIEIQPSDGGAIYATCSSIHDPRASVLRMIKITGANQPPVANAGPDQTVERTSTAGAEVQLDGSASSDPDGDSLTYEWAWAGGTASGMTPTVQLAPGLTEITLTVSDGELLNTDTVNINVVDTTAPEVEVMFPHEGHAVQDGVTFEGKASDISGVAEVYFYLREPGGASGTPIGHEDLPATLNTTSGNWELSFDTTVVPDGHYVILAKAIDTYGNEGWSELVQFSIRNWAVLELLPSSTSNKGGRTMPVKFSLRIVEAVDPAMPFVYNEQLEIRIYDSADPGKILQTSLFGDSSKDYRITVVGEFYITNFKTKKQPAEYVVEIWRTSKNFLVGNFTFETVK